MTDSKFETDTFICVNIAGTPSVQGIVAGTHLATTHPWTQHATLDGAIAAAQAIDPAFVFEDDVLPSLIAERKD